MAQKVVTWIAPVEGRWLTSGPPPARCEARCGAWPFSPSTFRSPPLPVESIRLRTWALEWPQGSGWNPAAALLIGEFAISFVIAAGPIAVAMALLRRWLRGTPLVLAAAFVTTFVYRQEVIFGGIFGAYVLLSFVGFAWFAWCFLETDLLGTVAAMFVLNGVVGTWALMQLHLDVGFVSFLFAFAALAALPPTRSSACGAPPFSPRPRGRPANAVKASRNGLGTSRPPARRSPRGASRRARPSSAGGPAA